MDEGSLPERTLADPSQASPDAAPSFDPPVDPALSSPESSRISSRPRWARAS